VLSVSNVKVTRILFNRWVAKCGLGCPELVVGQCGVFDQLIFRSEQNVQVERMANCDAKVKTYR
jgi:hypothetical protein